MTQRQTFFKDPDVADSFTINWEFWLAGETLATSSWVVAAALAQVTTTFTTKKTTITVSGGSAANTYEVTNTVTSNSGRTESQTLFIEVREK